MIRKFLILLVLPLTLFAQANFDSTDVRICKSKFEIAISKNLSNQPINKVMIAIGRSFLGTPYQAHTLEAGDKEELTVHLSGLDCYTFYESTLALSRCVKLKKFSFDDYLNQIEKIRYRGGKLNGYLSRLHYALDWLYDNQKRGIVKDVTKEIGGIPYRKKIDFMSRHFNFYKRLKEHPELLPELKKIEREINARTYYYIPQAKIAKYEYKINSGDILLLTTSIKGLGIGHTGIAIRLKTDGRIHFLHAPDVGKKVQITPVPLADYVRSVKKHTGIIVVRPLEPE